MTPWSSGHLKGVPKEENYLFIHLVILKEGSFRTEAKDANHLRWE